MTDGGGEDELGGALGLDGVGVGGGVGFAGLDGAAGDGVGGEEDGEGGFTAILWPSIPGLRIETWGTRFRAGPGVRVNEALGEGGDEGGFFRPGLDEGEGGRGCGGVLSGFGFERGGEGAAVEAGAGAGVLRGEAEGEDAVDAIGAHFGDDVGDEGAPVAHGGVDAQWMAFGGEGGFEKTGLGEANG